VFGAVKYGSFLSALINFVIIAFVLFLLIKGINSAKLKDEEKPAPPVPPAVPSNEEKLLMEIRDALKK
jgi:large conductance mechanosensitive channel